MAKLIVTVIVFYLIFRLLGFFFRLGQASRTPMGADGAPDVLTMLRKLEQEHPEAQGLRVPILVVRLGVFLAAADGQVDPREIEAIRRFFVRPDTPAFLVAMLERVMVIPASPEELPRLLAELQRIVDDDDREVILYALLAIINADGHIDQSERAFFHSVAGHLGLSPDEANAIIREAPGQRGPRSNGPASAAPAPARSDYDILGLDPSATPEQIKKAYRELARKYHPDRVSHLGPEFKELAEKRMSEINGAYARLN
jgi:DnaJ like chaperone protein